MAVVAFHRTGLQEPTSGHLPRASQSHRYLGIEIDDTLTLLSLIDHLVKQVLGNLAVLKRTKASVPRDALINILL